MTTIHSIVRESLREAAGLADSLMADDLHDAIATECEAAIRALLTSDAAVERATGAMESAIREWISGNTDTDVCAVNSHAMRAALEAALAPEGT